MAITDDDQALFRYRPVTDKTINALKQDRLYLSTPDHYNDPFDSVCYIDEIKLKRSISQQLDIGIQDGFFDNRNMIRLIREMPTVDNSLTKYDLSVPKVFAQSEAVCSDFLDSAIRLINNTRNNIISNSKVACFSELYDSILMWSHYADEHKGFAVVYTYGGLQSAKVYNSNGEMITRKILVDRIHYSQTSLDSSQLFFDETPEYLKTGKWSNCFGQSHLFYKLAEWSYEKEWRLWIVQNDFSKTEDAAYLAVKPSAVILGTRMSVEDKKKVFESVKGRDITILDSCPIFNDARFKLTIKKTNTKEIRKSKIQ